MRLAYRDDGILSLCWHVVSSLWNHGHSATFPPAHFVGLACSLSQATDPRPYKLSSIALRRIPSISGGPPWRLTYGWETIQPQPPLERSGELSAITGNGSFRELDGVARSTNLM